MKAKLQNLKAQKAAICEAHKEDMAKVETVEAFIKSELKKMLKEKARKVRWIPTRVCQGPSMRTITRFPWIVSAYSACAVTGLRLVISLAEKFGKAPQDEAEAARDAITQLRPLVAELLTTMVTKCDAVYAANPRLLSVEEFGTLNAQIAKAVEPGINEFKEKFHRCLYEAVQEVKDPSEQHATH